MELIKTEIVWRIISLVIVVSQRNNLTNAARDCISSFTDTGKLKIDCNNMNLGHFPLRLPVSTNILLLRNNHIDNVPSLSRMNLTQLEVLDLVSNDIQTLSSDTFVNVSQLNTLDLRYNPLFDSAITPADVFRPLSALKTLKLSCSMSSDLQKSSLLASTSVLMNLRQLYVTGSTDLRAAITIAAQFDSLEVLDFFDSSFPNIYNETIAPLRANLKLKKISFRKCGIEAIQEGAFNDLPFVETLSLACNSRLGLNEALNSMVDFDAATSNLSTVVLDHVAGERSSVMLWKAMVCKVPVLNNIKRLALQSNHIIGFQVGFSNCLNNTEVLSIGYNVFFLQEPEYPKGPTYPSLQFMRLFPRNLVLLSLTHLFNDGTNYLDQYCNAPWAIDVEIEDFFPPQSESYSEGSLRKNLATLLSGHISTYSVRNFTGYEPNIGYMPPKLKYLYADHIGMQRSPLSFSVPKLIYNPDNTLIYCNLSNGNMHLREIRGPIIGLDKLEVLDVSGLVIERVSQYWATGMKGLRKMYGARNLLWKMAPEEFSGSCKGAANMEELDISSNGLKNISVDTFSEQKHLKKVNLQDNQLKDLKVNLTYVKHLEFLSVAQNALDTLNEFLIEQLELVYQTSPNFTLDLNQNSFLCGCNNVYFIRWFQSTRITITTKANVTCRQDWIPGSADWIPISQVPLQEVVYRCDEFRRFTTIVGTLASTISLAILLSGVLMYWYRWRLRWQKYRLRRWVKNYLRRWRGEELLQDNAHPYNCDAFVVCTDKSDDRKLNEWLYQTLPNNVERSRDGQNSPALYILGRDDQPGENQCDIGCEVLLQARRILIVLHPSCINDPVWNYITMLALINRQEDTMVLEFGAVELADWPRIMRSLVAESQIVKRSFWSEDQDGKQQFWNEILDFLHYRQEQQD